MNFYNNNSIYAGYFQLLCSYTVITMCSTYNATSFDISFVILPWLFPMYVRSALYGCFLKILYYCYYYYYYYYYMLYYLSNIFFKYYTKDKATSYLSKTSSLRATYFSVFQLPCYIWGHNKPSTTVATHIPFLIIYVCHCFHATSFSHFLPQHVIT